MSAAPARCLIVGPSWIGDMIMAQSLYQRLSSLYPGVLIDVLAPAWSQGILARMPEVQRTIPSPFLHGQFDWAGRRSLARELQSTSYDLAIVLPNSWKSALVPFLARIPVRRGYVGEFRYGLLNQTRPLDALEMPRLADRYCALASADNPAGAIPCPPPRLTIDSDARQATLQRLNLVIDRPILALCPGAEFGTAKRWPEQYYASIANAKLDQGWQVWLLGSVRDQPTTGSIRQLTRNRAIDLAGQTQLVETVDLLSSASTVVSNDSGLMHVAAAVDVPLLAIYGSSDPGYTPPLSSRARILSLNLTCSPCFKRQCPLGHLDCLNKLEPQQVLMALNEMDSKHA